MRTSPGQLTLRVELSGPLAWLLSADEVELELPEGSRVSDALRALCEREPRVAEVLFDSDTGDPRTHFLVLINGRDIDVLGGLDAELGQGDVLTLIPLIRL
mgnify:CR=1 FL=1